MANVLIEEQTLKDIADSIRLKSGKSDLMLPSAMADEITNLPSGGGSSASLTTDIVLNKQFTFSLDEQYGAYGIYSCNPVLIGELSNSFVLVENAPYKVVWDGTTYECNGIAFDVDGVVGVGLGNPALLGAGANTGEPFVILYIPNYGSITNHVSFMTASTSNSHTVHIYQTTDIATVSFYNYDGSLLYQKPTIKGDDCMDVVAKGYISPTRESDNYNNYSFDGWSLVNDNTIDSDVLTTINDNRDVFACYKSSTRYYTVRFYSDGTLVDTVQVTYGQTASHKTVEKDGYKINGYIPSNENIISDTDINIQWVIDDGMIHDDWDVIASYCDDGSYATRYKVGDRKNLEINYADGTSETIPMRIVQLDSTWDRHIDDIKNKNAKLVFIADNLLKESRNKNYTNGKTWTGTDVYAYLNGDFLTYLPQTLQDSIVEVGSGTKYYSSIDEEDKKGKIWIPSLMEMWGHNFSSGNYYILDSLGVQYTEFNGESGTSASNNWRRYTKVGTNEVTNRWFRNVYKGGNSYMHVYDQVSNNSPLFGNFQDSTNAYFRFGILIGFCIG